MKPEDFEHRLRRQALRPLPPEWRGEILAAADATRSMQPAHEAAFAAALRVRLREALWPSHKTWGALAAVWLVVLAVNLSLRDRAPVVAQKAARQTPDIILVLQQQHQFMAELMGQASPPEAAPSRQVAPGPRSERREEMAAA
jgi:hypothetical protein